MFKKQLRYRYLVGFFVNRDGSKPVETYMISNANLTDLSVLINVIQRLALIGLDIVNTNMGKRIQGQIYELRKDRHRILFVPDGERFVLLSAFTKKTGKTPPEEIERAVQYYNVYQETGDWFELKLPSLEE